MTKEQKTLRINGIIIVVLGIALATATWTPLYPLAKLFLNLAHWPFSSAPEVADPTVRLLFAIGGGLTAGMGAMMWTIGTEVMPVAPQAGRKVILYSALTWFAVDSSFSFVAGSPLNAALNLIFLALMLGSLMSKERHVAV
ncbi:hypothetical protein [Phaeobacter sp. C3_T13_0]|uniref:hypothetical protein n=1 Tax=Phaeobacter cretensis TaxID=3342641 RepID=UPI0039BD6FB8